ncbi:hypothetical protein [Embleya sp. NPDC001921]
MDSILRPASSTDRIVDAPKVIRIPGSDVEFTCETVSFPDRETATVCAWADAATTGRVRFTPAASFDTAAEETRRIRAVIRTPIG